MHERIKRHTAPILLINIFAGSIAVYYAVPPLYEYVKSQVYSSEKIEPNEPNKQGLEYVVEK